MKRLIPIVIAGFCAAAAGAETKVENANDPLFAASDVTDLSEFHWKKRPVVVFADDAADPAFIEQLDLIRANADELLARDVVVITDTTPDARSALRLKMRPRGFMLVLVGKDGGIKLRKPFPWDVREISRSIDKMPMRQREIRDEKEG